MPNLANEYLYHMLLCTKCIKNSDAFEFLASIILRAYKLNVIISNFLCTE